MNSLAIFLELANTALVDPQRDAPPNGRASKRAVYSVAAVIAGLIAVGFAFSQPPSGSEDPVDEGQDVALSDAPTPPEPEAPTAEAAPPPPAPPPPPEQANAHRYAFAHHRLLQAEGFQGVTSPSHPTWKVAPGLDVAQVTTGLTYPVNIVFAERAPRTDDAPLFYVNELHGRVKYVTRTGEIGVFAENLINFEPAKQVKTDETGVSGLATVPKTNDLLVTTSFEDAESGLLKNRILRLIGDDDGKRMTELQVLLELDEYTSPSNQIQQVVVGSDDKLYVSVGDAENSRLSLDLNKFGGKLLRLNLDGSAPRDNPFYQPAAPKDPKSYVFAYGLRNVFDFDFDPIGGAWFSGDNGKDIDRLTRIERGQSYGWNGVRESVRLNSLYTWTPAIAPVGFTFLRHDALGSGSRGTAVLASYGPPAALGSGLGKALLRITLDKSRTRLAELPEPILEYVGDGRATVLGVAEGPDGVYFTDFFGETKEDSSETLGTVWRLYASDVTRRLATGESIEPTDDDILAKGKTYFYNFCASCHTLDGVGGHEGPNLTLFGENARGDLNSKAYDATLAKLIAYERGFFATQKDRLLAVQQAKGRARVREWLRQHLEEPRFDHARAKMPSMAYVAPAVREAIIEFLMSRVPEN